MGSGEPETCRVPSTTRWPLIDMRNPRITVIIVTLVSILLFGCDAVEKKELSQTPPVVEKPCEKRIVAFGDSLTAGLGVTREQSYPALLESRLKTDDICIEVINAGVSGETSSGALSRIDWVLKLKPDIVILETGANDGLRAIVPSLVKENIAQILQTLQDQDVVVVLAGMQMVTNLGPEYTQQFNAIYPALAAQFEVVFFPFFLQDVAAVASLNQRDGIHPNGEGYIVIVNNLYPYVQQAIALLNTRDQ